MTRDYYVTPKSSSVMRIFWQAAGGDRYILERATYSDQIKYMCLGGIVITTGVMAGLAGGYAFYTIFEPKGSVFSDEISISTSIISILFGIIWGLVIFNIDRFIVTSTGKGDGTEAITWDELKTAIPRIIMGAIIALTISKPVEIRMFKSEIDAELHSAQLAQEEKYIQEVEQNYEGRITAIKLRIDKWGEEIAAKEDRYTELENLLAAEMNGTNGGDRGVGPQAKKIEQQMNRQNGEIKSIKARNLPLIENASKELTSIEEKKQVELAKSKKQAESLDGLLERIKLAHEVSGPIISLFITLLFMAIELTPIFFKLMLIKTPYDYIEENIKELMKAEHGIYVVHDYFQDKEGRQRDLVKHINAEKILTEKRELQKVQHRLTKYALGKYEQDLKVKIDQDPSSYVDVEDDIA